MSSPGARGGTGRRSRVIDAAIAVLADKGVENASMLEIASTAGVPRATVYDDFGSKEGLIAAAVDRIAVQITAVDEVARRREPSPRSIVERVAAVFRWIEGHPSEAWLFYLWSRGAGPQVDQVRRDLVERHTRVGRAKGGKAVSRYLTSRTAVQTSVATVTAWLAEDYFPPGTALEDLILPQARVQSCLDGRPAPEAPMPLDQRTRSLDVDERVSLVLRILRGESATALAANAGMDADILRRWVNHFIDGGRSELEAEQERHAGVDVTTPAGSGPPRAYSPSDRSGKGKAANTSRKGSAGPSHW